MRRVAVLSAGQLKDLDWTMEWTVDELEPGLDLGLDKVDCQGFCHYLLLPQEPGIAEFSCRYLITSSSKI